MAQFASHSRYAPLVASLGEELFAKVSNSKILLIGAGGIGCELIKNLVLSGFCDIEVIDLDTIDVSNLNRQFLFRPRHVGKPKAVVAREMAMIMNSDAKIVAHHANIKEAQFGISYFKQFTVVMNALDNVDARRHVNRLCLAADKTLIEAGTTGFDGQTFVISKGVTACYECQPKPTQKVYPICTIRSTPDKPVHCVVWAKELFKLLFGNHADSLLDEPLDGPDQSVYMDKVLTSPSKGEASSIAVIANYAEAVITALFNTEISKQLSMDKYTGARFVPAPISTSEIHAAVALASSGDDYKAPSQRGGDWSRLVWSESECIEELCSCCHEVWSSAELSANIGTFAFDKDDRLAMRFVAAAANLRGQVFKIEQLCYHDIKGVAGNIVPAIATTNAIVAGQQVCELFKVLDAKKPVNEVCHYTYWKRFPSRKGDLLFPTQLDTPNPACYVCCDKNTVNVWVDTEQMTFEMLLQQVVKGKLGMNEPTISYGEGSVWEEGDDAQDFSSNLPKLLRDMPSGGMVDGVVFTIDDFSQDMEIQIHLHHFDNDNFNPDTNPLNIHIGDNHPPEKEEEKDHGKTSTSLSSSSTTGIAILDGEDEMNVDMVTTSKRPTQAEEGNDETNTKKKKIE